MNTHIYVISSAAVPDRFKIGHHTGDIQSLIKRYIDSIPDVVVHLLHPHEEAKFIERHIHANNKNRIQNVNGNFSEWYEMSEDAVAYMVYEYIDTFNKYQKKFNNKIKKAGYI